MPSVKMDWRGLIVAGALLTGSALASDSPYLRRYPANPLCGDLLLRTSSNAPENRSVFEDADIEAIVASVPVRNADANFTSLMPRRLILRQSDDGQNALAIARMMVSDTLAIPTQVPQLAAVDSPTVAQAITALGSPVLMLPWDVGSQSPIQIIERLQKLIETHGSGALQIQIPLRSGGQWQHTVLIDGVSEEGNLVDLRDPFHGWAIRVRVPALLKLIPKNQNPILTFLGARKPLSLGGRWKRFLTGIEISADQEIAQHQAAEKLVQSESLTTAAENRERNLGQLVELDFRPAAIEAATQAMNEVTRQIPLYEPSSAERAKLELAAMLFQMRILKLHDESVLLEFAFQSARRAAMAAGAAHAKRHLEYLYYSPEHQNRSVYESLELQLKNNLKFHPRYEAQSKAYKKDLIASQRRVSELTRMISDFIASRSEHAATLTPLVQRMRPFEHRFGQLPLFVLDPKITQKLETLKRAFDDWAGDEQRVESLARETHQEILSAE